MSNTKVLNYSATSSSASIRQSTLRSVGGGNGNVYSMRHGTFTSATIQTHPQQQHNMMKCTNKTTMMHAESTTMASQNRVREIKRQLTASNNLSPLSSPQLIRSTRTKATESNGWTSTAKVKSSCSSGSNSVESIVPKYQIATNTSSVLSQKRSYLNQTSSTINKLSNKSMCLRNTSDKSKKDSRTVDTLTAKKTVSTATGKKFLVKPLYPSSTSISPTKSFSSKFPNGLPFESEFYHFRKNARRSSVASDSTRSNNSSDEFNNNTRLSSSPYQDEFRRNPSNDALYVDFTLKHFNNPFDSSDDDKKLQKHHEISSTSSSVKTKYLLSDKNYFCEFESVKSTAKTATSSSSSVSSSQLIDDRTITGLAEIKNATTKNVIFISKANFFPKCNQQEQLNNNDDMAKNEWVKDNSRKIIFGTFFLH